MRFFKYIVCALVLVNFVSVAAQDANILDIELEELSKIRTEKDAEQKTLDELKSSIKDSGTYLESLKREQEILNTKFEHIQIALENKRDDLANIEISKTKLDNELKQIRQILYELLTQNNELPNKIVSRINELIDRKSRLKKELDKKSKTNMVVVNRIKSMETETKSDISSISKTIATTKENITSNITSANLLERKIYQMNDYEQRIKTIVLSLSSEEKQNIENKLTIPVEQEPAQPKEFIWPVEPINGLSATFLDTEYEKIFGIKHNAIDIPTPMRTEIKAIADGVVIKADPVSNDNYQFVILAHANGYSSVYGHLNQLNVTEGDLIRQGEVLGLSGGIPGTVGAGPISTGAHLHLEILLDGIHIDPLSVLE